jgi:hypothetical protein
MNFGVCLRDSGMGCGEDPHWLAGTIAGLLAGPAAGAEDDANNPSATHSTHSMDSPLNLVGCMSGVLSGQLHSSTRLAKQKLSRRRAL